MHGAAGGPFSGGRDAFERHIVIGHEEVLPQKEVQFTGGKDAVLAAVVHRVDDHEKIGRKLILILGGVLLHLWVGGGVDAVLNRQRMKVEDAAQDGLGFLRR